MERVYLELEEVAVYLKVAVSTLKQWLKPSINCKFRHYTCKIGGRVCITKENLERWISGLDPVGVSRFTGGQA